MQISIQNKEIHLQSGEKKQIIRLYDGFIQVLDEKNQDYSSYAIINKPNLLDARVEGNTILFQNKKIIINDNLLLEMVGGKILIYVVQ